MENPTSRSDARELLLSNMGWVTSIAHSLAFRYGLSKDEEEDFVGWVRLKLVEDDYSAIRKFRGESEFRTYLAVIVARLFHNHHRMVLGRWRPSAAATRLGRIAVRLEELVYREGHSLSEAIEVLRSSEADVPEERELIRLLDQLPVRGPIHPMSVGMEALRSAEAEHADWAVQEAEVGRQRAELQSALERALARLPEEDRVIVRLHFGQGLSIGDIARTLQLPQKPLYRRLDRLRTTLRQGLESEGINASIVSEALTDYSDP